MHNILQYLIDTYEDSRITTGKQLIYLQLSLLQKRPQTLLKGKLKDNQSHGKGPRVSGLNLVMMNHGWIANEHRRTLPRKRSTLFCWGLGRGKAGNPILWDFFLLNILFRDNYRLTRYCEKAVWRDAMYPLTSFLMRKYFQALMQSVYPGTSMEL